MRSTRDDRTTRAVIRDEALALFAAEGPAGVSLRRVAAAAGVAPGLIVHHFGSKEGLLEVTWDDANADFGYQDPRGDRALLELAPVPSGPELQFRR